ncbi:2-oxoglutarate dehydrogenase E1 component [Candidatus Ichthyocystis hellenicum]|uniref:oxoglutarate dehydrogenase (succinyl-transferring) n=2 Tax=Candidatus Ichthyocystis hellenicum TaxID=1561003 RepID=A0A0S4M4W1_9BURK|nr:2-oxoglutarate dehydrogenase E1 component [Candidatus Ichthyocystis hellenicum]
MGTMKQLEDTAYLNSASAGFFENLYLSYQRDHSSVSSDWQLCFERYSKTEELPSFAPESIDLGQNSLTPLSVSAGADYDPGSSSIGDVYRSWGYFSAKLDPLDLFPRSPHPLVADIESRLPPEKYENMKEIYCGSVAVEFAHISSRDEYLWLQERFESRLSDVASPDAKKRILRLLTVAESFEDYLSKRFVGAKRFGLDGSESFIVASDALVQFAGHLGVREIVVGMAHRGRLNFLVNIMGKSPSALFEEFEGHFDRSLISGDVKYHMGFSSNLVTSGDPVRCSMAYNPSHLEIVDAVVMGMVRSRQDAYGPSRSGLVLPFLVHGDAAFAGQGVVMETLNMSLTAGYNVGGTVHLVINNQIGFTTSCAHDARSSFFCTGVAKSVECPIFHVNMDDPEAVAWVVRLALLYRQTFRKDVVVDLVCFRRLGHNEQDEPYITQPIMYHKISQHPGTRHIYADCLLNLGICTQADIDGYRTSYWDAMDEGVLPVPVLSDSLFFDRPCTGWSDFLTDRYSGNARTSLPIEILMSLGKSLLDVPDDFSLHRVVNKVISDRQRMYQSEAQLDWGAAENLSYASLLAEGFSVRLSGQDCGRGTFAHRHAVIHDQKNGRCFCPLRAFEKDGVSFEVYDSVLSEEAVVAFEYGYAMMNPKCLVIWEAQYGDFCNNAQVPFDQFLSSSEAKWGRYSGVVCLLPHGFEGQGPEHSSARLERFLQLCAQKNMEVCVPTSAAQIFHLLRRQMLRRQRRPLIVMTPKSLLRKSEAMSSMEEIANSSFSPVIGDNDVDPSRVRRLVVCSGKVYYDLVSYRKEHSREDVAIVRIEQLFPFPHSLYSAEIAKYTRVSDVIWCQEEPRNMGAWYFICHKLGGYLTSLQNLRYAGRQRSASPAVGFSSVHYSQQEVLIEEAFNSRVSSEPSDE